MPPSSCKLCGRPIRSRRATILGFGRTCARKVGLSLTREQKRELALRVQGNRVLFDEASQ